MTTTLKTRKTSSIPGDARLTLTASAEDRDGRVWPKGTVIVPTAGGYSNPDNSRYQDASIAGERVRFLVG